MSVVGVCHPEWRGVRTSAYTFRTPIIEADDLADPHLIERVRATGASVVAVHGMPPGTASLLEALQSNDIATRVVLYSSPAQHGAGKSESDVIDGLLDLQAQGTLGRLGLAKEGVAEALRALGHRAWFVPARVPEVPSVDPIELDGRPAIGVFAEPFWRKNVVTQLAATALVEDAVAHVLTAPEIGYLANLPVVEHGLLDWERFIVLLGSVDINLYVTLSECLPLTPMESYLAGVPCLASRTSAVFRSDPDLWAMTTVDELDNPRAIAEAAARLLRDREEAVHRAQTWMRSWDARAGELWDEFIG